jgi:hypothetical protein
MPANPPLTASGSRDPEKRSRPPPKPVRDAVALMVRGRSDDPDGRPLDFIEAAKLCGIKPDVMRRWLDRTAVRTLLRAERRAFREAVCAGNEGALKRIRDGSENGMAVINAVRTLEQLGAEAPQHGPEARTPGMVIVIQTSRPIGPEPLTIDHASPVPRQPAPE